MIVAINGTQASIQAAKYAIMMAKCYKIELCFVNVIDTATIKYLSMNKFLIADERMSLEEHLKEDGSHYLDYVVSLAVSKGLKTEKQLRSGGVFTEIIKAAQEFDADLIVIGGKNQEKTGAGGIKRNVVSAVENELLVHSKLPVLVVQKENIDEEFKIF